MKVRLLLNASAGMSALDHGGGGGGSQQQQQQAAPTGQQAAPTGQQPPTGQQQQQPPPTQAQPGGQGQQQQAPSTPTPQAQMTPQEIARLSAEAAQRLMQENNARNGQQANQQPQYTEQDFKRLFNVYESTEQDANDIMAGGQQAVAALNRIVNGVTRQAMTMASFLIEQEQQKLAKQYGIQELHSDYHERRKAKVKEAFFSEYKDLAPHESIVMAVGAQLQNEGFQGTQAEAFAEVNKRVLGILKASGIPTPGSQPGGQGQQQQQGHQQQSPPAGAGTMPQLSGGGQGGAGGGSGGGGGGAKKHAGLSVFS